MTERQAKWVKDYMFMLLLEGGGEQFLGKYTPLNKMQLKL